jgi:DMSO/TMAO reductase YedYZ molybdopterin-dependent catalytic subunit
VEADFSGPDTFHSAITFDDNSRLTPVDRFYVQLWDLMPAPVDVAGWTLTISGLVDHPITLTYDDVKNFEPVTVMRTLECIGNPVGGPLIGNTYWTGFHLRPLLEDAGIRPEAIRAKFSAADRYKTSVELNWILQDETLLIYNMDGAPLTHEHGYPLRILMPGLYGQKMPKWITRIEFVDDEAQGYYEYHGWSDRAEVKTNSQIALPENFATITGTFALQGWAYAGRRRIAVVEISVDGGAWQPCDLMYGPSSLVWTQWWTTWTPTRTGALTVAVRATDETGFTQTVPGTLMDSAYPEGTDRIHSVAYQAAAPEDIEE